LKQFVEADAANESAEEANSGNCMTSSSVNESNGGEDAERDEDSKKQRSEARKRQCALHYEHFVHIGWHGVLLLFPNSHFQWEVPPEFTAAVHSPHQKNSY